MNQKNKNKIKSVAVTLVFAIILNISSLSFVHAAVATSSIISLANNSRSQEGLNALTANTQLASAALAKAQDMYSNQYFAHTSPQGKTPWTFIKASGYSYVYAGENLAIGYSDSNELHTAWMNSPTHRENIMNPNYREIGIAIVDGSYQGEETTIVVQMFGSSEEAQPVSQIKDVQSAESTPVVSETKPEPKPEPEVKTDESVTDKPVEIEPVEKTIAKSQPKSSLISNISSNIADNGVIYLSITTFLVLTLLGYFAFRYKIYGKFV